MEYRTYARAEQFLPWRAAELVRGGRLEPHWLDGERFCFQAGDGRFLLADPEAGTLTETAPPPETGEHPGEFTSPDGHWSALVRNGNVFLRPSAGRDPVPLTTDGTDDDGYALPFPNAPGEQAAWSPDSSRIAVLRVDRTRVRRLHLVQPASRAAGAHPTLHSYPYPLPGDEHVPTATLWLIDVPGGTRTAVRTDRLTALGLPPVWWSHDGASLYFIAQDRGYRRARLCRADAATGDVRVVIEERSDTRVDLHAYHSVPRFVTGPDGETTVLWYSPHNVRTLRNGDVLWYTNRDGWGHLDLRDGSDGRVKARLTAGSWLVHDVKAVDESEGWVYFTAGGREPGRDPYCRHLYRVRLDGTDLTLLTPEDADHDVTFSPNGRYFIDARSRVDLPPVFTLRRADGTHVMELQRADVSRLRAAGWREPEPFRVKAADGVTDLYGLLVFPSHFDPARRYPLVDDIYPGPHNTHVPKAFPVPAAEPDTGQWTGDAQDFWRAQALAELGFIVMFLDARGSALRGEAFHNVSYGNLGNPDGLADHAAAIRQLARERPYIDPDRVGIYGISAGGYAAARAILSHPDTFAVAVSTAGNHDPRQDKAGWIERYEGLLTPETEARYLRDSNASLAANLRGRLLLVHGDMDHNVHPALTMQLVAALIEANRDFDLLILPSRDHDVRNDPYYIRRLWDYFVRHLMGETPPAPALTSSTSSDPVRREARRPGC